ncbi:hypothetical protein [Bacteriophage sp.]|nr:hypothetical protein [Bacteriophage sp.]UOF80118.1 hypothetical protein [Bacteriophage sp.]
MSFPDQPGDQKLSPEAAMFQQFNAGNSSEAESQPQVPQPPTFVVPQEVVEALAPPPVPGAQPSEVTPATTAQPLPLTVADLSAMLPQLVTQAVKESMAAYQQQQPVAPVQLQVPEAVTTFQRFASDPAFAAEMVTKLSGGQLSPTDGVHVAMVRQYLEGQAARASDKAEMAALVAEVRALREEAVAAPRKGAIEQAYIDQYQTFDGVSEEMGETAAAIMNMHLSKGVAPAEAAKRAFATLAPSLKKRGEPPQLTKPVTNSSVAAARAVVAAPFSRNSAVAPKMSFETMLQKMEGGRRH